MELYDIYQKKIIACDDEIEKQLSQFESRTDLTAEELRKHPTKKKSKNEPDFNLTSHLITVTGVDLTAIPGVGSFSALKIISEIGLDMSRWKSGKQFASWLGLCPGNKVSGGKRLAGKTKRTANHASSALRMAAGALHRSDSALGAFLRRMKFRLGAPKAITATAHKLALIIYNMLKGGVEYIESGQDYYEKQHRERLIKSLKMKAETLGLGVFELSSGSIT